MELKVYAYRLSQPSRAVLIFLKVNGIEFEEVKIDLAKRQNYHSTEFAGVNPMKQVPAIVHGDFKLSESHAILIYLASAFPEVSDNWYPDDARKRAKIHSVLDWHHSNLRYASSEYNFNNTIAIAFGLPLDPIAAAQHEKLLSSSLAHIQSFWLNGDGPFLLGHFEPSIADISLVCEIMQIQVADEQDRERIVGPHKRVLKWIEDVKEVTKPHFDEIHAIMPLIREKIQLAKAQANNLLYMKP